MFFYNVVLVILAVLLSPIILVAFACVPKFRAGFWQKIGFYGIKIDGTKDKILIHAVSVGEVNAVENFVKYIAKNRPDIDIVLSTVTKTGQEVAKNKLKDYTKEILYFPYEFSFAINSFLNKINPTKIIIAETEIWPNFTHLSTSKKIPMYIINGRISPNSYKGYKKISFFLKKVLSSYTKILMQSEGDMERIVDIGAPQAKTTVMGNIKFDIEKTLNPTEIKALSEEFKKNATPIFIAASTHKGEDEIVLDVYKEAKKSISNLKLIIAPRHPQRFNDVENLIKKEGLSFGKRSLKSTFEDNDVIMLDTMGELAKIYSIADVAFIGGSFSNTGGHNPLEAAIWGVPTISGDTIFNFKDIYKLLKNQNAAYIAETPDDFKNLLLRLLQDKDFYTNAVECTKKVFATSQGALLKAFQEIF